LQSRAVEKCQLKLTHGSQQECRGILELERTLNEQKGGRTGKPESEEELKKGLVKILSM
jgi:hypothetical protein